MIVGIEANCTEAGLTDGKECRRCNVVLERQQLIPAYGHKVGTVGSLAPTCTESGYTESKICLICFADIVPEIVLPALGHNEVVIAGTSATCTESGVTDGIECSRCNTVLKEQTPIQAQGHFEVTVHEEVLPTCTEKGSTSETRCLRCETVLTESEELAALGHNETEISAVSPTCTTAGLTRGKECLRCGETLVRQNEISATGHNYNFKSFPCEGRETKECRVCGHFEETITQKQDHCQVGENDYDCRYCGKSVIKADSSGFILGCADNLEELIITNGVADYAFFGKNLRKVFLKSGVDYVGTLAFGNCAEDLVIFVESGIDTSTWAEDWFYGNGDRETPFTVIFQ